MSNNNEVEIVLDGAEIKEGEVKSTKDSVSSTSKGSINDIENEHKSTFDKIINETVKNSLDKKEKEEDVTIDIDFEKLNNTIFANTNLDEKDNISKQDEVKAKSFVKGLLDFLTNPMSEKKIIEEAQKNGLQPRKVAKTFVMKCLGTLSDVLHLALDTVQDAFSTLISILAGLLIKGGELLVRCAKRLVRIVTLNSTCSTAE